MATLERITDTTEEINVEAVFPRTDIASQNIPEQDTPTRPQITELSEDQIDLLSATQDYSSWMSLEQVRWLEDMRHRVSSEEYEELLSRETTSVYPESDSDALSDRILDMNDEESHQFFELMASSESVSSMGASG
jgi:hypothetical protein